MTSTKSKMFALFLIHIYISMLGHSIILATSSIPETNPSSTLTINGEHKSNDQIWEELCKAATAANKLQKELDVIRNSKSKTKLPDFLKMGKKLNKKEVKKEAKKAKKDMEILEELIFNDRNCLEDRRIKEVYDLRMEAKEKLKLIEKLYNEIKVKRIGMALNATIFNNSDRAEYEYRLLHGQIAELEKNVEEINKQANDKLCATNRT